MNCEHCGDELIGDEETLCDGCMDTIDWWIYRECGKCKCDLDESKYAGICDKCLAEESAVADVPRERLQ